MKKVRSTLLFLFLTLVVSSQDFSSKWTGHFSYFEITEITTGGDKIYAAADNAVFSYDTLTNTIEEFNTINGLSGESISTLYYSETYELLIIGYENGLIEIFFDNGDDVLSVVDIIEKTTIPPTSKRINHFFSYENVIYISTNFGISVFDLEKMEFGDTYIIGDNGSQIPVNQTVVFNNTIYAACPNGNGLRKAQVDNPNLINFQNWQVLFPGSFLFLEANSNQLFTINTNRNVYDITNETLNQLFSYPDVPLSLKASEEYITVTTRNTGYVYDSNLNLINEIPVVSDYLTQYVSTLVVNENIYIGTTDFGLLKTSINNPISFESIHPDGPLMNIPFSLQTDSEGVWVTYGEYDIFYNPYPLNDRGFSRLKNGEWLNTPYSDVIEAKCLNNIAINPNNNNQAFISSFFSGLLEVNEDIPTNLFNEQNSGLESLILPNDPNYVDIRVGASAFDNSGVLWVTTGLVDNHLKSYNPRNNQWQSFSLDEIITDPFDNNGFGDIVISEDGTKWLGSYEFGLIGFSNTGNTQIKNLATEEQNMPTEYVKALALDNRNNLWIGTLEGLRVLFNTSNFFEDENTRVENIIIEEDGIAKELLFQQFITDIKVDGSNNKWVGTADSGLFYFSPNGQNTIFHFTKNNSPLPSDAINDISLDDANGIVYIATSKGLVSFKSGGSNPFEDLTNAYAYPNPVRPGFNIVDDRVKIKDISENVNIKITDIEGNLVAEAQSRVNQRYRGFNLEIDGGTAFWNGKNLANNVVASGVYLIMLSDLDTLETRVIKLMVVR
ncbi:two-component regulator propeller domain-containing protein [Seonamhaeicola sp. ML3]|uniref:type IX secretion system anionic LPS delivery protein PorZ n=1 Tax=Seonamhaeicola sp. ML3 TaxID=2937786 RepID=UPI00200BA30A|nr:two-component regulator propeller domain-containing protein [Seonamhaeicola sp. ML3]